MPYSTAFLKKGTSCFLIFALLGISSPQTLSKSSDSVSLAKIMQVSFLMKRSQLLPSLSKKMEKKEFHRGSYFKGEIAEIKAVGKDLKKTHLSLREARNGFLLTTKRDGQVLHTLVEFEDPLKGII